MIEFGYVFIFALMMYGITNLLVFFPGPFGLIDGFRRVMKAISPRVSMMFDCMACTSTNVAWIFSAINLWLIPSYHFTPGNIIFNGDTDYWYMILILDAGFSTGIVWLLWRFEEMMNRIGVDRAPYDDGKPVGADIDEPTNNKKQLLHD